MGSAHQLQRYVAGGGSGVGRDLQHHAVDRLYALTRLDGNVNILLRLAVMRGIMLQNQGALALGRKALGQPPTKIQRIRHIAEGVVNSDK